jgi:hypothetical protein
MGTATVVNNRAMTLSNMLILSSLDTSLEQRRCQTGNGKKIKQLARTCCGKRRVESRPDARIDMTTTHEEFGNGLGRRGA